MWRTRAVLTLAAVAIAACNRGYQSAGDLEQAERGPSHCAQSCHDLNMRMSAFVLVESNVAGCVCEPIYAAPGAYPPPPAAAPPAPQSRSSTGAAAGYVVVELRRQEALRQQQAQINAAQK